MTGYELVNRFYLANLNYMDTHPDSPDCIPLALFLLGLIETAIYVADTNDVHPEVLDFFDAN